MAHVYKPGTWEVKQKDSSSKPVNTTQQDLKKIKIKNLKTKKYCLLSEYFISRFNTFFFQKVETTVISLSVKN